MLASPPERDELVAQLFHVNGGQWGEIYRKDNAYLIDFFFAQSETIQVNCDECVMAMQIALDELRSRLDE